MTVIKASTRFLFFELVVPVLVAVGGMIGWVSSLIQQFLVPNFLILPPPIYSRSIRLVRTQSVPSGEMGMIPGSTGGSTCGLYVHANSANVIFMGTLPIDRYWLIQPDQQVGNNFLRT
jgi:hypothetical protein